MMQIQGDFNFGTVVRNCNAFKAREAYYFGPKKKWDRRAAIGSYHTLNVNWIKEGEIERVKELRSLYPNFVALDIIPGRSISMEEYKWKKGTLIFLGEEQRGLSEEFLNLCDDIIHIPQGGSVRSINVGTASGIAMHNFMSNYKV